jgi:hypothetical protein
MDTLSPKARYAVLVAEFDDDPAVTQPERRGFAQGGLMRHGKLFATLRGDDLLLKLPADRVATLIVSGHGAPFDANKGKPMKEWVLANMTADWLALAREAAGFVGR